MLVFLTFSGPTNFKHEGHVGVGKNAIETKGSNVPPEVQRLLADVNARLKAMGAKQLTKKELQFVLVAAVKGGALDLYTTPAGTPATPAPASTTPVTVTPAQTSVQQRATTFSGPNSVAPSLPPKPLTPRQQSGAVAGAELNRLREQLSQKDSRIRELESSLRTSESTTKQVQTDLATSQSKLQTLTTDKQSLEKQVSDLKTAQTRLATAGGARGTVDMSSFNQLLETRLKELQASHQKQLAELRKQLEQSQKENSGVSDELANLKRSASNGTEGSKKLSDEVAALKKQLEDSTRSVSKVESEKRSLQAEVSSLQTKLDSVASTGAKDSMDKINELEKKFQAQLQEQQKENKSLDDANCKLREDLATLEKKLTDAVQKAQSSVADFQKAADLATKLTKAKEEASSNDKRILDLESELEAAKLKLESQRALQMELEKGDSESTKSLQREVENLLSQQEKARTKFEKDLADLEKQLGDAKSKLNSSANSSKEEIIQLQAKLQSQTELVKSLQGEIEELKEIVAEAEEAANAAPPAPPPPAAPTAPAPPPSGRAAAPSTSGSTASPDFLASIREGTNLKKVEVTAAAPANITQGDDLLNVLARSIIDRRNNMKEDEDNDEPWDG